MRRPYVSKYTPTLTKRREQAMAVGMFRQPPSSGKIECVVCGSRGYSGGSWMDKCIDGHVPCLTCGKQWPTKSINHHRSRAHGIKVGES